MDLHLGRTRGACLLVLTCLATWMRADIGAAQSVGSDLRHTSGWQASDQSVPTSTAPSSGQRPAEGQRSFFQSQSSLSDGLPAFPQSFPSSQPAASASPNQLPSLPASNLGRNSAGMPSGFNVGAPANSRGAMSDGVSAGPAANYNPQSNGSYGSSSGQSPAAGQQILPPNYQNSPRSNAPALGNPTVPHTTPAQVTGYQNSPNAPAPGSAASGNLRAIQNENGAQTTSAQNITTGLPYVTPPPTGRYATSPYRPAAYTSATQTAAPSQFVTATRSVPAQFAAQSTALPQYQQPGVYPTAYECTTPPAPNYPSTGAVPGTYVPPTLTPNLTPGMYSANNSGFKPFFSMGQENYNVLLGRGIIGQPTVYVPKQPFRNFLRYLSP